MDEDRLSATTLDMLIKSSEMGNDRPQYCFGAKKCNIISVQHKWNELVIEISK